LHIKRFALFLKAIAISSPDVVPAEPTSDDRDLDEIMLDPELPLYASLPQTNPRVLAYVATAGFQIPMLMRSILSLW
jgi:hypothetical protein